jgi:hypothetical protein
MEIRVAFRVRELAVLRYCRIAQILDARPTLHQTFSRLLELYCNQVHDPSEMMGKLMSFFISFYPSIFISYFIACPSSLFGSSIFIPLLLPVPFLYFLSPFSLLSYSSPVPFICQFFCRSSPQIIGREGSRFRVFPAF